MSLVIWSVPIKTCHIWAWLIGWVNKYYSVRCTLRSIRLILNVPFVGVAMAKRRKFIEVEIIKKVCQVFSLPFLNMGFVSLICLLESLHLHSNDLRSSKRKKIDTPLLETFSKPDVIFSMIQTIYTIERSWRSRDCTGINESKDFYWPWHLWWRDRFNQGQTRIFKFTYNL